jgi:Protein of unknown function (DUF1573)/Peptidase C39 family
MSYRFLEQLPLLSTAIAVIFIATSNVSRIGISNRSQFMCGHWCMLQCANMLGMPLTQADVLAVLPAKVGGHTFADISHAFDRVGLNATGHKESIDELVAGEFPCILHLERPEHFVLATSVSNRKVVIFDGTVRRAVSLHDLQRRWSGYILHVDRAAKSMALSTTPSPASHPRPLAHFDTLHLDKADIDYGQPSVPFTFSFKNVGNRDLLIDTVQTDCACLTSDWTRHAVAPNEYGEVNVVFRTALRGRSSTFRHECLVVSNDRSPIRLIATGNMNDEVQIVPPSLSLGARPEARTGYLFVSYSGKSTSFKVLRAYTSAPGVTLKVLSKEEYMQSIHAAETMDVFLSNPQPLMVIEVSACSYGTTSDVVTRDSEILIVTNVTDVVSIPFHVDASQSLTSVPAFFLFEKAPHSDTWLSSSVRLRAGSTKSLTVDSIAIDGAHIATFSQSVTDAGTFLRVRVELVEADILHHATADLNVTIDGERRVLSLPVYSWDGQAYVVERLNNRR